MSMWRCPHCGTPQAESSRCWVCHRSSTTCSTCRHFRRSVAAQLGYCGLDSRRLPLGGTELRGCWEPAAARPVEPSAAEVAAVAADAAAARRIDDSSSRLRDFVPVELRRDHRIVVGARDPRDPRDPREGRTAVETSGPELVTARPDREQAGLTFFGEREA